MVTRSARLIEPHPEAGFLTRPPLNSLVQTPSEAVRHSPPAARSGFTFTGRGRSSDPLKLNRSVSGNPYPFSLENAPMIECLTPADNAMNVGTRFLAQGIVDWEDEREMEALVFDAGGNVFVG